MIFGSAVEKKGEKTGYEVKGGGDVFLKDRVSRITGISREMSNGSKVITALENPKEYLEKKNDDLKTINDTLTEMYQKELIRNLNLGKTEEESDKKATQVLNNEKVRYMKQHLVDFPTELTNKTISKMIGRKGDGKGDGKDKD